MWKKPALLAGMLCLTVLANMNMACAVTVAAQEVNGLYSPRAVDRALTAAADAAEEIARGRAELPETKRRYVLTLHAPETDIRPLADELLQSSYGVDAVSGVYVNGMFIGTVEDGEVLREKLASYLRGNAPNAAVRSFFSEELDIRPVVSYRGAATDYDDMVLLITGLAPAMYTTSDGQIYRM